MQRLSPPNLASESLCKAMNLRFSIGCGESVNVTIPDRCLLGVLKPDIAPPSFYVERAINDAVTMAIEYIPQNILLQKAMKICIVIPDKTRILPIKTTLSLMLQLLYQKRKSYKNIFGIIATGTHPPLNEYEIEQLIGEAICKKIPIINHVWKEENELVFLGNCEIGASIIPVYINRLAHEADVLIGIGSVRPHRAVGWSGGAKIVIPGIAGKLTIDAWHWAGWNFSRDQILGEVANPMRLMIERVADEAGLSAVVNFVMNSCNQPIAVFGGNYVEVHRQAVRVAEQIFSIQVEERADVVIVGSNPAAGTMWSSVEGIQIAYDIIKKGGTIILLASCCQGVAPEMPEVLHYGYLLPPSEIRARVESGEFKDIVVAGHLMYVSEVLHNAAVECVVVSEQKNKPGIEKLGLTYARSPEQALKYVFQKHGKRCKIWALPMYAPGLLIVKNSGGIYD